LAATKDLYTPPTGKISPEKKMKKKSKEAQTGIDYYSRTPKNI
jgi:hypothetical protein